MNTFRKSRLIGTARRQGGLSLIELMVALVLGLFLMAGVIQLFLGSKQTYRFHEALSRIQENGRFAMEIMSRDVRMADFSGCPSTNPVANVLNNPAVWWANFGARSVMGYEGDQTFPGQAFGANAGERVAGTDAATFIGGEGGYSIVTHNPPSARFEVNRLHDFKDGDIVMVCDLNQTAILQLTNTNSSNVNIVHNTGLGNPGNCSKCLGAPVSSPCKTVCNKGDPDYYAYGKNSNIVRFSPSAFYIGVSQSANSRSLYRFQTQVNSGVTTAMTAQELLEGVQDMQILYGEDTTGDRQVNQYVTANNVGSWGNVLNVRVNLLMVSTEDNIVRTPMTVVFPADTGNPFTASDRRLYQPFSTTVGIRNRLP